MRKDKPIVLNEKPEVAYLAHSHVAGSAVVVTRYRKFQIDPAGDIELILSPHKGNEEHVMVREIL